MTTDHKVPWIHPGAVVHAPQEPVDALLAEFAGELRGRGFKVIGFVQRNHPTGQGQAKGCAEEVVLLDLATGAEVSFRLTPLDGHAEPTAAALRSLRAAVAGRVDLAVISRFAAFQRAGGKLGNAFEAGIRAGLPVLTSIAGRCVHKWQELTFRQGAMLPPDLEALWGWWGPERLYQDLALGVADAEVRNIVWGSRWLLVEGPHGTGLSYLPKSPAPLAARLSALVRGGLRPLAALIHSWDPLDMALGVAAINAHYNRYDLGGVQPGNGVEALRHAPGRRVVIGAFPGLAQTLPGAQVIETAPRPGEYPTVATDTLLPGCGVAVIAASTLVNRQLPRILRLARGARTALIGPATPLTNRLHRYGVQILGGLIVDEPRRLAEAVRAGARPETFGHFGRYVSLTTPVTPVDTGSRPARDLPTSGDSPCSHSPSHRDPASLSPPVMPRTRRAKVSLMTD